MSTHPPILIIDDDQGFRKTLSDILYFKGYKAMAVGTGQTALEKIALDRPIVALIDLKLEDMSGLDLLKLLKEQNRHRVECILLTGHATQKSAIEAVNLGAYGYMQKPYDIEQLLVMIRRAVEKWQAEEALWAYARRLETLREIDQAILEAHSSEAIAQAALHRIRHLVPCQRVSVTTYDFANREGAILAVSGGEETGLQGGVRLPLDAFALSEELKRGQIRFVDDVSALAQPTRTDQILQSEGIQAYVTVPLISQGELIGAFNLGATSTDIFTSEQIEIAQEVASLLAVAIQQSRLDEQVQRHASALEQRVIELQQAQAAERSQRELAETLREVTGALNTSLDREQVLRVILEQLARVIDYDEASVTLLADNGLQTVAARSHHSRSSHTTPFQVETVAYIQEVLNRRIPVIIADTAADPLWLPTPGTGHIRSWLGVPLVAQDRVIGLLNLSQRQPDYYTGRDAELAAAFAAQAAIAVANAQLFEQAHQEIKERMRAEAALEAERASLARRVEERTSELKAANAELAQASRLKDEFLANISHELRTPLNAILGLSEALQEQVYGTLNEKQLKTLNTIEESGRHLLTLINDILDVSKIEAGKLTLQGEWISVEEICQASLRLIKQVAQKKQIHIVYSRDSQVSTIYADQRRLKQILVNLLSNAVKFTPEGEAIGLEVRHDPKSRATLFIVWDTGIGIALEDVDRLFQPFVQIDSSLARQHSGTGLGLALVRRLTELHGGRVWLESQPGQGSRFTVSLPWSELYKTIDEITADRTELEEQLNHQPLQRALIIEDSVTSAEQLIRYLAEMGLETVIHPRAEGVLEKVRTIRPDVIILDILLSDNTGWTVLNRLKQDDLARAIPVIIISFADDPPKKSVSDIVEYQVKPISRQQLRASLYKISTTKEAGGMILVPSEPPRILLVEDNLHNIETISEYLLNKGYHLIVARNGQEAIDRVKEDCPDVILMDIQLPGMDGLEAIKQIRADQTQSVATTSIIALTALNMAGDRERCLQAGANEYLSKPVSLKELANAIERQLV